MPKLRSLHVAYAGDHTSGSGVHAPLAKSDIEELAASYSPELHRCNVGVLPVAQAVALGAPAVLGHFDPRTVEAKGALPSFGTVQAARAEGDDLYLDVSLTDDLANWIDNGMYDRVSLSWYDRDDRRNPTPGKLHVRHIGFHGFTPVVMKELQDLPEIEFGEGANCLTCPINMSEQPDTMAKKMPAATDPAKDELEQPAAGVAQDAEPELEAAEGDEAVATAEPAVAPDAGEDEATDAAIDPVLMLVSVLQDGDKGYKGEITGFDPEPTADNSYLWNAESQQYAGVFLDDSGYEPERYEFSIQLEPDGSMTRSYKKIQDEAVDVADDATVEAEADAAAEMGEYGMPGLPPAVLELDMGAMVSVSAATLAELQAKADRADMLERQAAMLEHQAKVAELAAVLQPMYDGGALTGWAAATDIAAAIVDMFDPACCDYDEPYEFSEAAAPAAKRFDVLKQLLSVAGQRIAAGAVEIEMGEVDMSVAKRKECSEASGPADASADPAQADLHSKALAYAKANGLDATKNKDYAAAVKAVQA